MTKITPKLSPQERVRKVADLALADAVELTELIGLMNEQNEDGVNSRLDQAGAARAAICFRNALIARLVTLIARAYAEPKEGDLHMHVAAKLLKHDTTTRQIFTTANFKASLAEFEAQWKRCRGDHRLPLIKHFRDKYTAHLGEPKDVSPATYKQLFEFGAETAKAMELLALCAGIAEQPLSSEPDLVTSPKAFWAPWKQ